MSWSTPPTPMAMFTSNDQAVPDVALIIEDSQIKAHKSYLSLISPVFKAMFEHPTTEAKTGQVHITDFTLDTVKKAIDYLYGQALIDSTHQEVFDIYRFVDKYDIDAARKFLVKRFKEPITADNFFVNAKFGWTFSNANILRNCVIFLAGRSNLILTSKFQNLDQPLIVELMQRATVVREAILRCDAVRSKRAHDASV